MGDWNETKVIWKVVNDDLFSYHKNYACVPNVSYGLLMWEADLLVMSRAGYMSEVEAKVTMRDWKADKFKKKFKYPKWNTINYFWYAAPKELAMRWEEAGIPDYAGVIGVQEDKPLQIIKPALHRKAKKWSVAKRHTLTRLGVMRYWKLLELFVYHHYSAKELKEKI